MKQILTFFSIAASFATYAMEKTPDASAVKQHYNFLNSFPLEGKAVYIFGCGHGDQNEHGMPEDHGNHSHKDAICFDNNQESGADYIIDLTKDFIPEEVRYKADIVYFEYLTPLVIYHPQTFTNARLCLKEGGMIMWDCYSYVPLPGHYEKWKYYEYIKTSNVIKTIDALSDSKFNGLFNLNSAKKNILNPGIDRFYFSYVDNPFNGRRNSQIFHLPFDDLNSPKDNISGTLPKKLLSTNEPRGEVTNIQTQEKSLQKNPIMITPINVGFGAPLPNQDQVIDDIKYFIKERNYSDNSLRIYFINKGFDFDKDSRYERTIASVRSNLNPLESKEIPLVVAPMNNKGIPELYQKAKKDNENSNREWGLNVSIEDFIHEINTDGGSSYFGRAKELLEYHKKFG